MIATRAVAATTSILCAEVTKHAMGGTVTEYEASSYASNVLGRVSAGGIMDKFGAPVFHKVNAVIDDLSLPKITQYIVKTVEEITTKRLSYGITSIIKPYVDIEMNRIQSAGNVFIYSRDYERMRFNER
jgi:hypothetical protein